jgi:hypothetical protein
MVENSVGSFLEDAAEPSDVQFEHAMADFVIDYTQSKLVGHVQRFSQFVLGGSKITAATSLAAHSVGAMHVLVETMTFVPGFRRAQGGYSLADDGTPTPGTGYDTPTVEPCYLPDAICVATLSTEAFLLATRDIADQDGWRPAIVDGYCRTEHEHNIVFEFRESDGWSSGVATDGRVMVPTGGLFRFPADVAGSCPFDPRGT